MAIKMTRINKEKQDTISYPCLFRCLESNSVYLAFDNYEGFSLTSGIKYSALNFSDWEVYEPFTGKIELENV